MPHKRRWYFKLPLEEGSLGDVIRRERLKHDWTQEELAERTDVDQSRISSWETGKHIPRFETLLRLDEAFELELGTLYGRSSLPGARYAAHAANPIPGSIVIQPSETQMIRLVELADELNDQEFARVLEFIEPIRGSHAKATDNTSKLTENSSVGCF